MSTVTHHRGPSREPRRGRASALDHLPEPAPEVNPLDRALLTPEQAARVLGIGRSKVYELILAGSRGSVKIGARRRVPTEAIDSFVAGLRSEPA